MEDDRTEIQVDDPFQRDLALVREVLRTDARARVAAAIGDYSLSRAAFYSVVPEGFVRFVAHLIDDELRSNLLADSNTSEKDILEGLRQEVMATFPGIEANPHMTAEIAWAIDKLRSVEAKGIEEEIVADPIGSTLRQVTTASPVFSMVVVDDPEGEGPSLTPTARVALWSNQLNELLLDSTFAVSDLAWMSAVFVSTLRQLLVYSLDLGQNVLVSFKEKDRETVERRLTEIEEDVVDIRRRIGAETEPDDDGESS